MQVQTNTIFVPTTSLHFEFRGRPVNWIEGRTTIEEGHPILKGRMDIVRPLELDYPVEKPQKAVA